MATPRSATALHKRMRRVVLAQARARGVTNCPGCQVELDYDSTDRPPNAAEADEIIPFAVTRKTSEDPDDWQVLCRTCNRQKSDKIPGEDDASGLDLANPYPLSRAW